MAIRGRYGAGGPAIPEPPKVQPAVAMPERAEGAQERKRIEGLLQNVNGTFIIDLNNQILKVTDVQATPILRINLGKLGAGNTDYGIEIFDSSGTQVFSASGLGVNTVGNAQMKDNAIGTVEVIDGAITADKITVTTLSAITANIGTITAGTLSVNVIFSGTLTASSAKFAGTVIGDATLTEYKAALEFDSNFEAVTANGRMAYIVTGDITGGQGSPSQIDLKSVALFDEWNALRVNGNQVRADITGRTLGKWAAFSVSGPVIGANSPTIENVIGLEISIGSAGTNNFAIKVTGDIEVSAGGVFSTPTGSASLPSYAFFSDRNTGMYSGGADTIRWATAGVERMSIDATGTVSMGALTATTGAFSGNTVVSSTGLVRFTAQSTDTAGRVFIGAQATHATDVVLELRAHGTTYSETLLGLSMTGAVCLIGQPKTNGMAVGTFTNLPLILATNNLKRLEFAAGGAADFQGNSVKMGAIEIDGDLNHDGAGVGFYGTAPVVKQGVDGSRGGNAALLSLLEALEIIGLLTDLTT